MGMEVRQGRVVTLLEQRERIPENQDSNGADREEVWKRGNMGGAAIGRKKLRYVHPLESDRKPIVHLDSNKFQAVHKKFENMVVGRFVGRRLMYQYAKDSVKKTRKLKMSLL